MANLYKSRSKFDRVGPSVDDDIRRAIVRYGAQAVVDSVKRLTKSKRGRKAEKDWPELVEVLKQDARTLLEGGDPFSHRTNYSIAKSYADKNPGHNYAATFRRIMRKLSDYRVVFTLINAINIGKEEYPYGAYIRVLRQLSCVNKHYVWTNLLQMAEGYVADYEKKFGAVPENLTMEEVEEGARSVLLSAPEAGQGSAILTLLGDYQNRPAGLS